ncbi:MAG: hypothetical protein EXR96_00125 [Nitrospiraceae bacterium]|nr:hypothetical protein [Nitrospiraceae bacterium]
MLIWCAISSHGLGHAAQVVPVLNELGRIVPDLHAVLRTQVPAWFFEDRLTIRWTRSPEQQDIGCIQHGPLTIDVAATWGAHARFHAGWEQKVHDETLAMRAALPALVFSDISYLAIEAGATAGIPTVGLCNLSWDRILEPLAEPGRTDQREAIQHIQRAYAHAGLMLRPAPGVPLTAFPKVSDIGPIAEPASNAASELRRALAAAPGERIVLIGFGGIALDTLPFECLEQMGPYRFIVSGPVPDRYTRIHAASALPFSFRTLLASADLIVTKPGYSTVVEAVALGKPVVYVRRYNFADEQALVDYLHRHGRAVELSEQDFTVGRWQTALQAAASAPLPCETSPALTGAADAAQALSQYLK